MICSEIRSESRMPEIGTSDLTATHVVFGSFPFCRCVRRSTATDIARWNLSGRRSRPAVARLRSSRAQSHLSALFRRAACTPRQSSIWSGRSSVATVAESAKVSCDRDQHVSSSSITRPISAMNKCSSSSTSRPTSSRRNFLALPDLLHGKKWKKRPGGALINFSCAVASLRSL